MVNAFSPVFRNPKNYHLKNFYAIVPPLTINYIEHSLTFKEHLNKRNKEGSAFTDDGFAIGLAYIIVLLDQRSEFNSLHWFQSVRDKHMQARKQIETQKLTVGKNNDKLQQTLTLSERRIEAFENVKFLFFAYYNFIF